MSYQDPKNNDNNRNLQDKVEDKLLESEEYIREDRASKENSPLIITSNAPDITDDNEVPDGESLQTRVTRRLEDIEEDIREDHDIEEDEGVPYVKSSNAPNITDQDEDDTHIP